LSSRRRRIHWGGGCDVRSVLRAKNLEGVCEMLSAHILATSRGTSGLLHSSSDRFAIEQIESTRPQFLCQPNCEHQSRRPHIFESRTYLFETGYIGAHSHFGFPGILK
jgi:hypothetical protein